MINAVAEYMRSSALQRQDHLHPLPVVTLQGKQPSSALATVEWGRVHTDVVQVLIDMLVHVLSVSGALGAPHPAEMLVATLADETVERATWGPSQGNAVPGDPRNTIAEPLTGGLRLLLALLSHRGCSQEARLALARRGLGATLFAAGVSPVASSGVDALGWDAEPRADAEGAIPGASLAAASQAILTFLACCCSTSKNG